MTDERYTLDANILFYAMDADATHRHVIAKQLWRGALIHDCAITLQAMAETYNAIARKRPDLADDCYRMLTDFATFVPVIAADMTAFSEAMQGQRTRRTQFWDTMLWATAKSHGCQVILTEDAQDRPVIDGVRYLDPFRVPPVELSQFL